MRVLIVLAALVAIIAVSLSQCGRYRLVTDKTAGIAWRIDTWTGGVCLTTPLPNLGLRTVCANDWQPPGARDAIDALGERRTPRADSFKPLTPGQ
ncbi:MAG: hypothetical protein U0587_08655 [Candidatus Binatia bacterium]